jgi:hypothetical protein
MVVLSFFEVAGRVEEGGIGPEDVFGDVDVAVRYLSAIFEVYDDKGRRPDAVQKAYEC